MQGVKDKSDPPDFRVALKSMKIISEHEQLVKDNIDMFVDFVNYLTRWMSSTDPKLVEAALTSLVIILESDKSKKRFIEIAGLTFLINTITSVNVRIADS